MTDALGSTIELVGSAQSIATNYTYQPFEATTVDGAATRGSYEFNARENDGTGLYFHRMRYYSPTFLRFIAQDPIGFGGREANLYSYVRNRPLNIRDPLGLWSVTVGWYEGPGGSITFGQNTNGTNFVSGGVGAGAGGGVVYNLNGTSPGYDDGGLACRNSGLHGTIGIVGGRWGKSRDQRSRGWYRFPT